MARVGQQEAIPTEFWVEQRLQSVERAKRYWATLTDVTRDWLVQDEDPSKPHPGDKLMEDLLDAIESSAISGSIVDYEDMSYKTGQLGDYIAQKGGASSMAGRKVALLLAHMGESQEGTPNMDYKGAPIPYDYPFWMELCGRLNGVTELGQFKAAETPSV
jgi:hypothetical protein